MQVLLQVQRMSAVPPEQQYRGLRHALLNIPAREGWQVPALWWLCNSDALNAPSMLHESVLTALHLTAMQLLHPPPWWALLMFRLPCGPWHAYGNMLPTSDKSGLTKAGLHCERPCCMLWPVPAVAR